MNSNKDVLSFMDLLDLNEDVIDERLQSIMHRDKYSNKHLFCAIQLFQYKHLINEREYTDCENDEECDFAAKLIKQMSEENIENVCKIVASTLSLNTETIVSKSEHLLQQILSEIDLSSKVKETSESPEPNSALLSLKISDSILETVIEKGGKLTLPFLEIPVKNILLNADEQLKIHFLTSTVPKLFEGIEGFNILDKIWDYIKQLKDNNREVTLKVISSLSDYYLPVANSEGEILFETEIVCQYEFWKNILYGLSSTDPSLRKISIYLAKRALDCVIVMNKNICVKTMNNTIFVWDCSKKSTEKTLWDNFFILMDSLEEKQSNIVLPSLQLFGSLIHLGHWLTCAFNIGLKHDNTQVRLKCIQHRLKTKISSQLEAKVLLEALNDINIYDNPFECEQLKKHTCKFISDKEVFVNIIASVPLIKWSPVPLYHISSIISEITFKDFIRELNNNGIDITKLLIDILKVPCNNIVVRKAVTINISHFIASCCDCLHWKDFVNIYCVLRSELKESDLDSPISLLISKISIKDEEKIEFFQLIECLYIDFCLLYLQHHPEDMALFIDVLLRKIKKTHEIITRQYSDKAECLKDVICLIQLYKKNGVSTENINIIMVKEYETILYYLLGLLSNNTILSIDEMRNLSNGFSYMSNSINNFEPKEILLQLYKTSVLFMKDKDTVLESKILSMFLVHVLSSNRILLANYNHEMIGFKDIITLTFTFKNTNSMGRLRNIFYEKSCEILDSLLNDQESNIDKHAIYIAEYIENVIESGGYGCLKWCLKIMNVILPSLLQDENNKFDVTFINRMWKEIEELKSNNQYNPCIEEFVNLITQDVLLKRSMYNNIIILYCNKIMENGAFKTGPLFYLIRKLNSLIITADYGQIIYVLCEVLLYSPVPRKDQRIIDNLVVDILQQPKYGFNKKNTDIHFNYQIQYLSILTLCKIKDKDILDTIAKFIKKKVDEIFGNKQRYHGHSHAHRLLLTALQHLLLIFVLKPRSSAEENLGWCLELLGKLPHQPSVRICLEWYISLHLCLKKSTLNKEVLEPLKNIPLTSQFLILYWIVKHKILSKQCSNEEYEFVMDVLLSHTMGQMFNIRLHAQYLAVILHSIYKNDSIKYSYIIQVIERTFIESAKDKNFIKLQEDYFVNNFDIVKDFTPSFIYYFLPRYCEINNESVDIAYVKNSMKKINKYISKCDFFKKYSMKSDEVIDLSIAKTRKSKVDEEVEILGTIQKKYIPWKNMSNVNVYDSGKKNESPSRLLVVASLIDKLPNLGGMARTGEVFGVQAYVVDSLRHLQDKQFQGLSVSAERWISIEEVRPGAALKAYLARKKAEGYAVVAAEQTSTSCKLQSFRFPEKTLLLLGHEKEGIPCDLLPMMDHCVEIPQQGFVRSLNVHVTAAIFIWEYTRQNIL